MKFICIEGNIGSGKSSLAQRLAAHLNANLIREEFDDNPFLPLFYREPDKFAFPLEFSFLIDRARQLTGLRDAMQSSLHVADYYIEKCLWFAEKNLSPGQFTQFLAAYPTVKSITPEPELLIFIHLPDELIIENIVRRGRKYEESIDPEYLKKMNLVYAAQPEKLSNVNYILSFKMQTNSSAAYEKVFSKVLRFLETPVEKRENRMEFIIG